MTTNLYKMAFEGRRQTQSYIMKQKILNGNKTAAKSLMSLCTVAAVGNIKQLINDVPRLPDNLRARILHLMSKRNNLLTDETLPLICSEVIRELDFTNTSLISDLGLLLLPKLAYLRKLDLNDTRTGTRDSVTSDSLVHMAKQCPNLQIAYFRRCRNVCDRGIRALAQGCKRLLELNLSGCPLITDDSVQALANNCHHIRSLNLAYSNITDASADSLAHGACAKQLQEVHISHCQRVTDEGVAMLLYGGVNITYLEIQGCPLLTDESVDALDQLRDKFDLKQFNYTITL